MIALVLAFLLSSNAFAQVRAPSQAPIVLRAERDDSGVLLQQAVFYGPKGVTLSRNSNFMCKPSARVRLGEFRLPTQHEIAHERGALEEVQRRLESLPSAGKRGESHSLRLFWGTRDVTDVDPAGTLAQRILLSACEAFDQLTPRRGVEVALKKGQLEVTEFPSPKPARPRLQPLQSARCRKQRSGTYECTLPKYGRFRLTENRS